MGKRSGYRDKIETRIYERLLRLRYRSELEGRPEGCNLEFALRLFRRGTPVDLLSETDTANIYLALIGDLIMLVCLDPEGDAKLVLADVFRAYRDFIDKKSSVG